MSVVLLIGSRPESRHGIKAHIFHFVDGNVTEKSIILRYEVSGMICKDLPKSVI